MIINEWRLQRMKDRAWPFYYSMEREGRGFLCVALILFPLFRDPTILESFWIYPNEVRRSTFFIWWISDWNFPQIVTLRYHSCRKISWWLFQRRFLRFSQNGYKIWCRFCKGKDCSLERLHHEENWLRWSSVVGDRSRTQGTLVPHSFFLVF